MRDLRAEILEEFVSAQHLNPDENYITLEAAHYKEVTRVEQRRAASRARTKKSYYKNILNKEWLEKRRQRCREYMRFRRANMTPEQREVKYAADRLRLRLKRLKMSQAMSNDYRKLKAKYDRVYACVMEAASHRRFEEVLCWCHKAPRIEAESPKHEPRCKKIRKLMEQVNTL